MINFLADGMFPFSVALLLMVLIGVMELVSLTFGISVSSAIDDLLPDIDLPDGDIEADGIGGPLSHLFSWLSIGRVPALILLVIFLCSFAVSGYAIQLAAEGGLGAMLDARIATIPAAFLGLIGMGRIGALVGRILPKDHSQVASRKDMIGSIATISIGVARQGMPAEARAQDLMGRSHHIRIEPLDPEEEFQTGTKCLIVKLKPGSTVYQATTKLPPVPKEA